MIKQKLNFISLGCAKALVDSEKLIGALKNTNYDITDNPEDADTMVINTCGFIDMARQESIDTILQATELRTKFKENNVDYFVYKNTLTKIAIKNAGLDENDFNASLSMFDHFI